MSENKIDVSNMHHAIYAFPDQMVQAMTIGESISLSKNYENLNGIVVAGMGGSAIGGDVARVLAAGELTVPMFVSRDYSIPNWVNQNSLVICSSYSGNTEETLSAFQDANSKKAQIIGISTGGTLTQNLQDNNYEIVGIPSGLQPRAALAFSFIPMLYILHAIGLINYDYKTLLQNSITHLKTQRDNWGSKESANPAHAIARKIRHTIPILYSDSDLSEAAAIRFKGQLNENANMHAWCNRLPELNHNEIVGWENNKDLLKQISLVWVADKNCHQRTKSRRDVTRSIVGSFPANDIILEADQNSGAEQLLHLIHLGDWISYWCALEHGTDPTPVVKIDQLKKILSELI